jgi:hypothetical protein
MNYSEQKYIVNSREGYDLTTALRLWKTKYQTDFNDFVRNVTPHESLFDFRDFVESMWEDIIPVTVEEALSQSNTEDRRIYFDAIGVQKLFKELNPTLRDKQTIKKKRTRWDDNNDSYEYEFEDVYELYEIDGKKLYETDNYRRLPMPVYAVRCWCTTTNREYWIYVNATAATGNINFGWRNPEPDEIVDYDAIRAIAWTIRLDVKNPERIYRQGDIIVAKLSPDYKQTDSYHLSKEQYLSLMYSET